MPKNAGSTAKANPAGVAFDLMTQQQWRSGEVLAWTEQDGPGRPPAGPRRWQTAGLAGLTAGVVLGMMFTDTLCPEHRSLVMAFGSIAFVCLITASIGLWRDWAAAPMLSLVASVCGVGIGVIDVTHAGRDEAAPSPSPSPCWRSGRPGSCGASWSSSPGTGRSLGTWHTMHARFRRHRHRLSQLSPNTPRVDSSRAAGSRPSLPPAALRVAPRRPRRGRFLRHR